MYLPVVKLMRALFWAALATAVLTLLMPNLVPYPVPLVLAAACVGLFLWAALHIRNTRRHGLRCPWCGWTPFALSAWKCKQCRFVWDSFSSDGVCPRCGHAHEETACVRCRRIARNERWQV